MSFFNVVVGVLEELGDDALDVVAHVTGHGEGGAVADGEGNVQASGDGLGQEGLSGSGGAEHHDVGLLEPKICFP